MFSSFENTKELLSDSQMMPFCFFFHFSRGQDAGREYFRQKMTRYYSEGPVVDLSVLIWVLWVPKILHLVGVQVIVCLLFDSTHILVEPITILVGETGIQYF